MKKEELEAIGGWAEALLAWVYAVIPYTDEARIEDIVKVAGLIRARVRAVPALLVYVAEAIDLLGDDGAALGLVEAIKRRNFMLTEARDQHDIAWKVATDAQNDRDVAQRRVANLERAIDDFITAAKGTRS